MVKTIALKCPSCDGNITVEDREFCFCQYCGTKIMLHNENEKVYRKIDEAKIARTETERLIELKKLEMEQQRREDEKKSKAAKQKMAIPVGILTAICLLIGFPTLNIGFMMIALFGVIFLFSLMDNK